MTDGLITRIGKWIDNKWESKATESQLVAVSLDAAAALNALQMKHDHEIKKLKENLTEATLMWDRQITDVKTEYRKDITALASAISEVTKQVVKLTDPELRDKELADLKTRLEKIELYSGMTRKVDPTKPPIVKSAFQM